MKDPRALHNEAIKRVDETLNYSSKQPRGGDGKWVPKGSGGGNAKKYSEVGGGLTVGGKKITSVSLIEYRETNEGEDVFGKYSKTTINIEKTFDNGVSVSGYTEKKIYTKNNSIDKKTFVATKIEGTSQSFVINDFTSYPIEGAAANEEFAGGLKISGRLRGADYANLSTDTKRKLDTLEDSTIALTKNIAELKESL